MKCGLHQQICNAYARRRTRCSGSTVVNFVNVFALSRRQSRGHVAPRISCTGFRTRDYRDQVGHRWPLNGGAVSAEQLPQPFRRCTLSLLRNGHYGVFHPQWHRRLHAQKCLIVRLVVAAVMNRCCGTERMY
jgi:hypothetical protein